MKNCVMIYNSNSGKNKPVDLIKKFEKILNEYDYSLRVIYTKNKGHASEIVESLDDDVDLVISAGGDGTFNEVINGNVNRKKKLLVANLPMGTTNDIATMYGYKNDYIENLKLLLDGEIRNIDICRLNDKAFVYFAGIGSFVNVTYDTPRKLKEKYGRNAYIIYALKQFNGKLKKYDVEYEVDGKNYSGKYNFIFITNSSSVAGVNNIYPDVKLDDNMFEVLLCDFRLKFWLLRALMQLRKKDVRKISNVTYFKTNKFNLKFNDKVLDSWCIDGEELKHNDSYFSFSIQKDISVMLPKSNLDKLFDSRS